MARTSWDRKGRKPGRPNLRKEAFDDKWSEVLSKLRAPRPVSIDQWTRAGKNDNSHSTLISS